MHIGKQEACLNIRLISVAPGTTITGFYWALYKLRPLVVGILAPIRLGLFPGC